MLRRLSPSRLGRVAQFAPLRPHLPALASLLPPSTLVLASSATGVLGPLMDERSLAALKKKSREHSSCGHITEVEARSCPILTTDHWP